MTNGAIAEFLAAVAERQDAESLTKAFSAHLANVTTASLPPLVQPMWRDVARLLKSSADKPIPEAAIAAVRSWPATRLGELVEHIRKASAALSASRTRCAKASAIIISESRENSWP
ncbi:MAG: hypothetical protein AB7O57_12450 [Hyphomicrobiaceae bacterium]